MKVRAVTIGAPVTARAEEALVSRAGTIAAAVTSALTGTGIEVQTTRFVTPPLDRVLGGLGEDPSGAATRALDVARTLEGQARDAGFGYVALGAIDLLRPGTLPLLTAVPEIVRQTEIAFCAATVATHAGGINLEAVRECGRVVAQIAAQTDDGFGNLRFAALANCLPNIPFFPAAYHDGGAALTAGIALEAADLVVAAFDGASDLQTASEALVERLVGAVQQVASAARGALAALPEASGSPEVRFTGVDLSPAPFPADDRSIAFAFERLGLPAFGANGTLFLASFLTDCLQAAWERLVADGVVPAGDRRFGFSGLMLPVLEDSVLAVRGAEGAFGVDSLLLYSAVCGLGLDTVPLPGDTSPEELAAIVLDMAALATKLNKPLTARLFPVPGKRAGEPVSWDFAFFSPSRTLPLHGKGPSGALARTSTYNPRQPRAGA